MFTIDHFVKLLLLDQGNVDGAWEANYCPVSRLEITFEDNYVSYIGSLLPNLILESLLS